MNGVALVELLNSFDSGSAELAIDAYFIVMAKIKQDKQRSPHFIALLPFFIDSRLSAKIK